MCEVTDTGGLDHLLGVRSVCRALDCSSRQLRRLIAGGRFPAPDGRLGRSLRWRASTIRRFVDQAFKDNVG